MRTTRATASPTTSRASSAPRRSAIAVEPTRSATSTVITRRSSRIAGVTGVLAAVSSMPDSRPVGALQRFPRAVRHRVDRQRLRGVASSQFVLDATRRGPVARVLRRVMVVVAAGVVAAAPAPALAASGDWPQYLHGPQHSSVSATTAKVVWKRLLDVEAATTCAARGITSTAAVVPDPTTGTTVVYVSGARDLYALNSTTGAVIWKTMIGPASPSSPNAYYDWSSPTVVAGHVYVGLSSSCDKPQVRSGVVELNQHTGAALHTWYDVPAGSIGGSVWASVAASSNGHDLWV